MLMVKVSTFSESFLVFTLNLAASLDGSYPAVFPPRETSLFRATVHSPAPGQVRMRYSPLGTLIFSTFTSVEKEIFVPLFAPVLQIVPCGYITSFSPNIFLPFKRGRK